MNDILDRSSGMPLYRQLRDELLEELPAFSVGDKFYSDREICRKYQVSPAIARKAIGFLVSDGYIKRQSAKGTFVENNQVGRTPIRHGNIAIISPVSMKMHHANALKGIMEISKKREYDIILADNTENAGFDDYDIKTTIENLAGKVDGYIWISPILKEVATIPDYIRAIANKIVFIDSVIYDSDITCVLMDVKGAVCSATTRILARGFERILFLGGSYDKLSHRERYAGFKLAMNSRAIEINPDWAHPFVNADNRQSRELVLNAFSGEIKPDALLCGSPAYVFEVMETLKELNINIPDDLAMILATHSEIVNMTTPPLASLEDVSYKLGKKAASLLMELLQGNANAVGKYQITPSLLNGASLDANACRISSPSYSRIKA